MLAALVSARRGLSKDALHAAINGAIEIETDPKIVDVLVCKLRRKLPRDVAIETIWGFGYVLSDAGRAFVTRAMESER
jgi:DNA-binding response OmpR family regulator